MIYKQKHLFVISVACCLSLLFIYSCSMGNFIHRFNYDGRTKLVMLSDSICGEWPNQNFQDVYLRNLYLFQDGIQLLDSSLIDQSFAGEYYLFDIDMHRQKFYISNYRLNINNNRLMFGCDKPKVSYLFKYEEPFSFIYHTKGEVLNIYCLDLNLQLYCALERINANELIQHIIDGDETSYFRKLAL